MTRLALATLLLLACSAPVPPTPRDGEATATAAAVCAGPACVQEGVKEAKQADGISIGGGYFDSRPFVQSGSVIARGAVANPAAPAAVHGTWAYAKPSHGPGYLAIPEGPGWIVLVCGPLTCIERVSTDAGPELWLQKPPHSRIGDLSAVMFREVCGPLSAGLCRGSYAILGAADQSGEDPPVNPADDAMRAEDGPKPTVPPTSTEGEP